MYTGKEIKTYIAIRRNVKLNAALHVLFVVFCFLSPVIGWAPFNIPPSSMPSIGIVFGIQLLMYCTPKYGAKDACELIEKAINNNPDSLKIYSEIKSAKNV